MMCRKVYKALHALKLKMSCFIEGQQNINNTTSAVQPVENGTCSSASKTGRAHGTFGHDQTFEMFWRWNKQANKNQNRSLVLNFLS